MNADTQTIFNPLLPTGNYSYRIINISFKKKEGIKKNISFERRVYESVLGRRNLTA